MPPSPHKTRAKTAKVIQRRPRVGPVAIVIIAFAFAAIATPIIMADEWVTTTDKFVPGETAPTTVRVAQFSAYDRDQFGIEGGAVVIAYGEELTEDSAALARTIRAEQPFGIYAWLAFFGGMFLLALLYALHVRRSHEGKWLRTQVVTLSFILGIAAAVKALMLFTPMSPLVVPVAGAAIVATLAVDLSVGLATGLVTSVLIGLCVPFDLGVLGVLTVQATGSVLILGDRARKNIRVLAAGLFGGIVAALAYVVFFYLTFKTSPGAELDVPLHSAWLAAGAGGVLAGIAGAVSKPIYQYMLGDITKNKLVELEDLSNPMLKQIAEKSPGTWQHSLAMANMAEIAANTIGANGRLVRVGAYYHDLGKSLQSKYFIENLDGGETSPHDRLAPEVSCDAIFAHVTEGIALARKNGLPERVIDFMHMHHGDGVLEYFWAKCEESGNPKGLTREDFRYPGVPPQTRETAILAICDAVEAASRTLRNPDPATVQNLVRRIVYGKLDLGQLDESGLSMSDLRKISKSLCETIKHAHHGRIEYPWQREQREAEAKAETTAPQRPGADAVIAAREAAEQQHRSATQRIMNEPRLDSLDAPRPYWSSHMASPGKGAIEHAATERVATDPVTTPPVHEDAATEAVPVPVQEPTTPEPPVGTDATLLLTKRKEQDATPEPRAAAESQPGMPAADSQPGMPAADSQPGTPAADSHPGMPAADSQPGTPAADSQPGTPAADSQPGTPAFQPPMQTVAGMAPAPTHPAREPAAEPTPQPAPAPEPEPVAVATPAAEPTPAPAVAPLPAPVFAPVPAPAPEPEPAPAPAPEPAPEPAPASELAPESEPAPAVKGPAQVLRELVATARVEVDERRPTLERKAVSTDDLPADTAAEIAPPTLDPKPPVGPRRRGRRAPAKEDLAAWDTAIKTATGVHDSVLPAEPAPTPPPTRAKRKPPPPPGSPQRTKRGTIRLMDDGDDKNPEDTHTFARASSENDELKPGMMVMGPPPGTRPKTVSEVPEDDEITGEHEGPTRKPAKPATSMMPPRTKSGTPE